MVFAMNLLRQSVKPGSLRLLCAVVLFGFGFWASNLQVEAAQQPLTDAANTKAKAAGSEELITDDGTPEVALVLDNAIGVNRLTPSAYPATLQTIRIYFAPLQGLPSPAGAQIKLIAFAGASGTTAPPANPTLLFNQTVTIPTLPSGGGFVDFPFRMDRRSIAVICMSAFNRRLRQAASAFWPIVTARRAIADSLRLITDNRMWGR
ncbi:MAG: hypothetical protein U0X75_09340 [Acidobacteriota bacterium]